MGFWDILKHKYMTHMTEYKIKQLREEIPNAYDLKRIIPYDFIRVSDDGSVCVLKKKGRRLEFYIVVVLACLGIYLRLMDNIIDVLDIFIGIVILVVVGLAFIFFMDNMKDTWLSIHPDKVVIDKGFVKKKHEITIPRNGTVHAISRKINYTNKNSKTVLYIRDRTSELELFNYREETVHARDVALFLDSIFAGESGSTQRINVIKEEVEKKVEKLKIG